MSQAHDDHDLPHEGPIKTPKQLIWAVVLAFVVPIIAIILLVNYVTAAKQPAAGSDGMSAEAVARRIEPVGRIEIKDVSDPASMKTGEQVYAAQCVACHGSGAAGAPKIGDAAAWAPRLKSGYDALLAAALKGKGAMGAQGGGDFSDLEIGRAVVYLANQGGAKFEEPKLPAAPAAAAAATPSAAPAAAAAPAPAAVVTAAAPAAKADAVPALYTQACAVCHAAGVANAPKLGDKAAWAPRLAAGVDGLTASVIKGKGAMPPKGGAMAAADADIKAVVSYMVGSVK
ncbi:MAG TPA: c-type cytochrome [Burkholderiaceae bacterium]|jgi:cytochrome c5|nr:c-type cytochrome [Burkholderiaceae bacterium]